MCTCISFKTADRYFGRNMDLHYRFGERIVVMPRGYALPLKNADPLRTKYAVLGMATVQGDYPLFADACNEAGLCLAGLNFPGSAVFAPPAPDKCNLAPYELIPYFLGLFSSVRQCRETLGQLNITNVPFSPQLPNGELHFMLCDGDDCLVIEQTRDGLHVYDNPVGVLSNNPPFPYHLENLKNYRRLSAENGDCTFGGALPLPAYGGGMGAIGLPGDASPASRFVRAAFYKHNSVCARDELASVTQFFHILGSVAMVKGGTVVADGKLAYATYSCCINADKGIYYCKTYDNNAIFAVTMHEKEKTADRLTVFPLIETQRIDFLN